MFIICRSPKGGVGTSVVAAALALRHAHAGHPTVLVDLAGDQPDLLGVSPSSSVGRDRCRRHGVGTSRRSRSVSGFTVVPAAPEVEVVPGGGRVTVVVRFDAPTNVPIVGALVGDLALDAEATMRLER